MIAGLVASEGRPRIPGNGPQSVAELLERPLAATPDAEALVGRYARYSFAELDARANQAAQAFSELGIAAGDRVAATLPNHPDIVIAFLGAMRLGAIWVGIPRALAGPEKAYMLEDCGARVYLVDADADDSLASQRDSLSALDSLIEVRAEGADAWSARLDAASHTHPPGQIDPFAPAAIAYTSGTTGLPKGAVHSQHNLLVPGAVQRWQGRGEDAERHGVCLPLTLLNLMVLGPLVTAQLGTCCVTMDRVDALGLADWIERERIGGFSAVPTMVHDLLHHPEVREEQLSSLTRPGVGGADLPESFRALYRERFGAEVTIGYGMTEAPTTVAATDPSARPIPNEAGVALPHLDVHIRDEQGQRLGPEEVGEICVAARSEGPWAGVYTPMLGYWGLPDATAEALRDGILHTGDLGSLDEAGHLFVKDRRNELILRGGANVYPAEVERVLHGHDAVQACAVVGEADERLGQRVVAFVEASASEAELRAYCRAHLARYKVPEHFEFVDALPRTAMGKIRKSELKQAASAPPRRQRLSDGEPKGGIH